MNMSRIKDNVEDLDINFEDPRAAVLTALEKTTQHVKRLVHQNVPLETLEAAIRDDLARMADKAVAANDDDDDATDDLPEFPLDVLPAPMVEVVSESCRIHGVRPDLPASIAMGITSAAVGRGAMLELPPHMTPAVLHLLVTALSGSGKSETARHIARPLFALEAERVRHHREHVLPGVQADIELLKAEAERRKKGRGGDKERPEDAAANRLRLKEIKARLEELENELHPPRLLAEDVTNQALGLLLSRNSETISIISTEAGDVLANILGRFNDSRVDDAPLLKGFSLESCRVDRVGRASLFLSSVCIPYTLIGTPDLLTELIANPRLMRGGFLARALLLESQSRPRIVEAEADLTPDGRVWASWNALISVLVETYRDAEQPVKIYPTPEAAATLRTFANERAGEARRDILQPARSRQAEQAARIGLNLHLAKHGVEAGRFALNAATAEGGIAIARFYFAQFEALAGRAAAEGKRAEAEKLTEVLKRRNGSCTMGVLKKSHKFSEDDITRIVRDNPRQFVIEDCNSAGRPTKKVKFA